MLNLFLRYAGSCARKISSSSVNGSHNGTIRLHTRSYCWSGIWRLPMPWLAADNHGSIDHHSLWGKHQFSKFWNPVQEFKENVLPAVLQCRESFRKMTKLNVCNAGDCSFGNKFSSASMVCAASGAVHCVSFQPRANSHCGFLSDCCTRRYTLRGHVRKANPKTSFESLLWPSNDFRRKFVQIVRWHSYYWRILHRHLRSTDGATQNKCTRPQMRYWATWFRWWEAIWSGATITILNYIYLRETLVS